MALTEGEFIDLLLKNERLFELEKLKIKSKEIDVKKAHQSYGDWKWDLSANISKKQTNILETDDQTYQERETDEIKEASSTFQKNFLSTGATLSLKFSRNQSTASTDKIKIDSDKSSSTTINNTRTITTDKENGHRDNAKITLKIPLLKNRAGVIDQKTYDVSKLDLANKKLSERYKTERILAKNLELFLKWGWYEKQLYTYQRRLKMAQKTLNRAKSSTKSGKDILFAQNSVNTILQNISTLAEKIQAIKIRLTKVSNTSLAKEKVKINWNQSVKFVKDPAKQLQKNNILLQKITIQQKINQRNIKTYRNAKSPDLDLSFSAERNEYNGDEYTSYSYLNKEKHLVSLNFSYPLFGNVSNNASLAKSVIKIRQLQIKYEDSLSASLEKLQQYAKKLKSNNRKITEQQRQVTNTQKVASQEMINYFNNKIDIRFLLRSQDSWRKNAMKYNKLLFEYRKNSLRYDLLLNRLLRKYTKM